MTACRRIAPLLLLVTCCTTGCANKFFYYPDQRVYQTPAASGLKYEPVTFASRDGTKLSGWFVPATGTPKGTVVHFHGNAQNMTAHFSFVRWLPEEGFNLFVFDYRGYGKSEGTPGRTGIYEDCIAALDYVAQRPDVDPKRLLLLGQSLGGANAIAVAGRRKGAPVRAVAIDSAFYSYRLIARDALAHVPVARYFRWPLSFLVVTNSKTPSSVVDDISPIPLLLFHGTDDRVIPYRHGQKLHRAAQRPKALLTVEGGRHMDAFSRRDPTYRRQLVEFFETALQEHP